MAEEQEERGFTVSDKRFSARRESAADRPGETSQARPEAARTQATTQTQSRPQSAPPPEAINFSSFLISLGTQAFMHLGDIPNPVTNQREKDVAGAKQMIDLLGLLQVKTKGNLTNEEERLLQQLLFDLRMRYVRETGR
jgi:hypothetical protein